MSLTWFASDAQADGIDLGHVSLALDELTRRAVTGPRLRDARLWRRDWLLNAGRPAAALALTDSLEADQPWRGWARQQRVDDALFQGGDTAAAAADVRALATSKRPHHADPTSQAVDARAACRLGLWSLSRSDSAAVRIWWQRTRVSLPDQPVYKDDDRAICSGLLGAWLAWRVGRPDYHVMLQRVDSIYLASDVASDWPVTNLVTAQLREATGDLAGARRAVNRVLVTMPVSPAYIATYLREQGRLALKMGDTASAVLALRRYVSLRDDAEPALRPEVDRERARLSSLLGR